MGWPNWSTVLAASCSVPFSATRGVDGEETTPDSVCCTVTGTLLIALALPSLTSTSKV